MIFIIFLGQILGDVLMTIVTDWNFPLGKVGSGGGVNTLRHFGDPEGGVALRWSLILLLIPLPVDTLPGLALSGLS
jgi:hypothetical protein